MSSSLILYVLDKLMAFDWIKNNTKRPLQKWKKKAIPEFEAMMQDYDYNDQRRIKKFFNELIDIYLKDIPKKRESFQSIIDEGDFYPSFGLDPNWTDKELHMHLRFALRAKLLRDSGLDHERFDFCTFCADFLDYQELEESCKHEHIY